MADDKLVLSRRGFAASGLVAGFALTAGPLRAAALITDEVGIEVGEVSIPVMGGDIPAYRARPAAVAGSQPSSVILVVQEVFGVHEHIRDICRRFAKLGYYAIAPSLYARQGDPGKYGMGEVQTLIKEIVSKVPDAQVMQDLDFTVAFAQTDRGDIRRLGITGFCWGGRVTWLYCAHASAVPAGSVKAGVAWYGALKGEKTDLKPLHPVDVAASLKAPVLGLYGGLDKGIPLEDVDAMRAALTAAGQTQSRIDVFPDAQHGFFADYRQSYDAEAARAAFADCLAFFKEHGVG